MVDLVGHHCEPSGPIPSPQCAWAVTMCTEPFRRTCRWGMGTPNCGSCAPDRAARPICESARCSGKRRFIGVLGTFPVEGNCPVEVSAPKCTTASGIKVVLIRCGRKTQEWKKQAHPTRKRLNLGLFRQQLYTPAPPPPQHAQATPTWTKILLHTHQWDVGTPNCAA